MRLEILRNILTKDSINLIVSCNGGLEKSGKYTYFLQDLVLMDFVAFEAARYS